MSHDRDNDEHVAKHRHDDDEQKHSDTDLEEDAMCPFFTTASRIGGSVAEV